jgi:hypothetical protein
MNNDKRVGQFGSLRSTLFTQVKETLHFDSRFIFVVLVCDVRDVGRRHDLMFICQVSQDVVIFMNLSQNLIYLSSCSTRYYLLQVYVV